MSILFCNEVNGVITFSKVMHYLYHRNTLHIASMKTRIIYDISKFFI